MMDRLDKCSISAMAVLMVISIVVMDGHRGEAKPEQTRRARPVTASTVLLGNDNGRVVLIRKTIEAGNFDKAEILVRELMGQYPYEGMPFMLMGDVLMRRQRLLEAMDEYRSAVDLNPDFIDKKSALFEGGKLKVFLTEVGVEIDKGLKKDPADVGLREKRKTLYYLKRRLAGGCG